MGFFATFSAWLNGLLANYIGNNTTKIAGMLEPAILTLAVIYVMIWGYLQLTGPIEEPFVAGVKRIVLLAVILGCALDLWLYNGLIVDTFFNAPGELRIPAMTDSCSGDDGHHRSEATQAGGLLYRLSAMVPRGIGLAHGFR